MSDHRLWEEACVQLATSWPAMAEPDIGITAPAGFAVMFCTQWIDRASCPTRSSAESVSSIFISRYHPLWYRCEREAMRKISNLEPFLALFSRPCSHLGQEERSLGVCHEHGIPAW